MRYNEQERLKNKSNFKIKILHFINGMKELYRCPWKNIFLMLFFLSSLFIWKKALPVCELIAESTIYPLLKLATKTSISILCVIAFISMITRLGTPFISGRLHDNLLRIGFNNRAGETPVLISKYKIKAKPHITTLEFLNNGIPYSEFERRKDELETILNTNIIKIGYGKNKNLIILQIISSGNIFNTTLYWNDDHLDQNDFVLTLGESPLDTIKVNLSDVPHILIGGASGSGKSILLKLVLSQCIAKGAITYIADFKGGVDFNQWWHKHSKIILDEASLLDILTHLVNELEKRKVLFSDVGSSNIIEYNSLGHSLKRLIFACDEIAEILDKTGLDKTQKTVIVEIEKNIAIIARQGRAFGIHLVLATQRPDANVLTGQIKSNINYRICGRADSILSSIILDNPKASEAIPSDSKGLFVNHENTVFQGYYFKDKTLN